eukprot:SAG31_NODE_22524_length_523_cov_44.820755_1_plen_134_part_10
MEIDDVLDANDAELEAVGLKLPEVRRLWRALGKRPDPEQDALDELAFLDDEESDEAPAEDKAAATLEQDSEMRDTALQHDEGEGEQGSRITEAAEQTSLLNSQSLAESPKLDATLNSLSDAIDSAAAARVAAFG